MIKAIIIEDERNSQNYILNLLNEKFPNVHVVSITDSVNTAVSEIEINHPDLIFLDVQIIGGTGFDVLDKIKKKDFEVIFITAFSNFSILAIKQNAIDYILKPINDLEFENGVKKALDRIREKKLIKKYEKIIITSLNNTSVINQEDIYYLKADGVYTNIITNTGTVISSKNIGEFEFLLSEELFLRCHNSYIVNIDFISKFEKRRSGEITLLNGDIVPVSQRKVSSLNQKLKQ